MATSREVVVLKQSFLKHRLELAPHEWALLKANDSLGCRNCHSSGSMDITRHSLRAAEAHGRGLFTAWRPLDRCGQRPRR